MIAKRYACTAVGCDQDASRLVMIACEKGAGPWAFCSLHAAALVRGGDRDVGVIGEKGCWCGCPEPVPAHKNARYASNACTSRAWKARHGYRLHARRNARQTRKRSGRQTSYHRAVHAVAGAAASTFGLTPDAARLFAERALTAALPERQRSEASK